MSSEKGSRNSWRNPRPLSHAAQEETLRRCHRQPAHCSTRTSSASVAGAAQLPLFLESLAPSKEQRTSPRRTPWQGDPRDTQALKDSSKSRGLQESGFTKTPRRPKNHRSSFSRSNWRRTSRHLRSNISKPRSGMRPSARRSVATRPPAFVRSRSKTVTSHHP